MNACVHWYLSIWMELFVVFDESLSTVIVLDFSSNNSVGVVIQG